MKKVLLGSVLATTLFASNGAVFAERTQTQQDNKQEEVSLNTELQLPENGGFDGKVPNNKSEHKSPSTKTSGSDRQKAWGFSYVPKGMSTENEVALAEREKQDFNLNVYAGEESTYTGQADQNIHIGVKNKTRLKSEWQLQAKLESNFHNPEQLPLSLVNNPLTGATFKLQDTQAKENKTSEKLKENEVKLEDFSEGELKTSVSGEKEINTDVTSILEGKANIVHNAIYDYSFTGVKFSVPNTRRMPVGEYKTQITWTLAQVPGAGVGGPAA